MLRPARTQSSRLSFAILSFGAAVLGLVALAPAAWSEAFRLDPARTEIRFEVGAQGYPVTRGLFRQFTSTLFVDFDAPSRSKVNFRVASGSLDTQVPALDAYVRGPVFLNAGQFPDITFTSSAVEKLDDHRVQVTGILTMLGVSKPETFLVDVTRQSGANALHLEATGRIKRSDFGMIGGLPLVSDEVGITVATLAAAQ